MPIMAILLSINAVQASPMGSMIDNAIDYSNTLNGVMRQFEFYFDSFFSAIYDDSYSYKQKHSRATPQVSSLKTNFKNNFILATAIGITMGCYATAFIPLLMTNDAGAFFTDCTTMWTMYVYFFEDEKFIDYQQFSEWKINGPFKTTITYIRIEL